MCNYCNANSIDTRALERLLREAKQAAARACEAAKTAECAAATAREAAACAEAAAEKVACMIEEYLSRNSGCYCPVQNTGCCD